MKRIISLMVTAALVLCALPALAAETWSHNVGAHPDVIALLGETTAAGASQGFPAQAEQYGVDDPDTLPGMKAQVGYAEIAVVFDGELQQYLTLAEFIALVEQTVGRRYFEGNSYILDGDILRITEGSSTTYYFYTGDRKNFKGSIEDFDRREVPYAVPVHQQDTWDGLSVGDLYQGQDGVVMLVMYYVNMGVTTIASCPLTNAILFIYPAAP